LGRKHICGLCIWDVLARALVAASPDGLLQNHQALLEESDVRSQVCDRVVFSFAASGTLVPLPSKIA